MAVSLKGISNQELAGRLKQMAAQERALTYSIVLHLAEFDSRRLYAENGFSSTFDFATRGLGYSRASAQRRIVAARIIQRFPEVYTCLLDGRLSLRVLEVIADAMELSNARELLTEVCGKSRDEALRILAYYVLVDERKLKESIEPIVLPGTSSAGAFELKHPESSDPSEHLERPQGAMQFRAELNTDLGVNGEGDERLKYHLQCTIRPGTKRKLDRAKELLFASHGNVSAEMLLDMGLDLILSRHCPEQRAARRKAKAEKKLERQGERVVKAVDSLTEAADKIVADMPEAETQESRRRFPSQQLRDEVLVRDGHQCMFVAKDGTRCACRKGLQIDHIKPFALGGATEPGNLRAMCAVHNYHFARKLFGDYEIDRIIARRKPDDCGRPLFSEEDRGWQPAPFQTFMFGSGV